nr:hypothetical protein [Moorena sp. SIOASIH]
MASGKASQPGFTDGRKPESGTKYWKIWKQSLIIEEILIGRFTKWMAP